MRYLANDDNMYRSKSTKGSNILVTGVSMASAISTFCIAVIQVWRVEGERLKGAKGRKMERCGVV